MNRSGQKVGAWPDIKIFLNCLTRHLLPGEHVKADNGYVWHPDKVKCPNNDCNPEKNLGMQSNARSRYKIFNGHLKNWGILERTYRQTLECMGWCSLLVQ